jgi:putative drug exporter of the RND superfamily
MAMAILIGLAVAITLIPALLAIGGRAVFWPRRPGVELSHGEAAEETPTEREDRPRRTRALALATRRPVLTAALTATALVLAASGLARVDLGNPLIRGLPEAADAREAYVAASQGFAAGVLSPTVVVVEGRALPGGGEPWPACSRRSSPGPGWPRWSARPTSRWTAPSGRCCPPRATPPATSSCSAQTRWAPGRSRT